MRLSFIYLLITLAVITTPCESDINQRRDKTTVRIALTKEKQNAQYLRQCSDWSTHSFIRHSDKTHGDLLHCHLVLPLAGCESIDLQPGVCCC